MLTVCLPTYRYDVRPLVAELLRQSGALAQTVEILVYDDASPDDGDWGRAELRTTSGIRYVELTKNLGRAAIRNRMAHDASHDYLVMMDADGWPGEKFILHWLYLIEEWNALSPDNHLSVTVGGRIYAAHPPANTELHLHWWYGTQRESLPEPQRRELGSLGFQSNNFLTRRQVVTRYPFPEQQEGYGHEDTLWGQQIAREGVFIGQVTNPVVHLGLEPAEVFLGKQHEAIRNLRLLHRQAPHLRTRLIDLVQRYPALPGLARLIPERRLKAYLTDRKRPSLYALDLLKLRWWAELSGLS